MEEDQAKRDAARENWRRIAALWAWMGRRDREELIFPVLSRYAPDAPLETLRRAQLGDPRGGGRLRESNARAIVGPLLGVDYGEKRPRSRLEDYKGPAPPELLVHLRSLPDHVHIDLADQWVTYLRGGDDEPAPWAAPMLISPTPTPTPTHEHEPAPRASTDEARGQSTKTVEPTTAMPRRLIIAVALVGAALAIAAVQTLKPSAGPAEPRPVPVLTAKLPTPAPPTQPPVTAAQPQGPGVRIEIEAERAGDTFSIVDGARLQHGDRLAFYVESDQPLYAWVFGLDDEGRVTLLYPPGADLLLQRGRKQRIPNLREGSFELDDQPGKERLLLVTTNLPIARDDARLKQLLEPLSGHEDWPKDWPSPSRVASAKSNKTNSANIGPLTVRTRNVTFIEYDAHRRSTTTAVIVTAQFLSFDHQG